jgi:galactoside O-acetyltransferase
MFYSREELEKIGFKSLGKNVLISDKCSIYNPKNIEIANNVRIDDFCILSAGEEGIIIGSYIHIACFSSLIGKKLIQMDDFSGLSSRVSIYSSSDDYSGAYLTNPMIPKEFLNVHHGRVHLKKHVLIGSGSVILPDVILEEGVAVGALSLVSKSIPPFKIVAGVPCKIIKDRQKDLLEKELQLYNHQH